MPVPVRSIAAGVLVLVLLAGCGPAAPTATPAPPTATPLPATSAPLPPAGEPDSADRYLGQIPPGLEVKVFAPGIVSTEEGKEYKIAIAPDLNEILFTRRTPRRSDDRLWYTRLENGQLTAPELAPFGYDVLESDACFAPDGKRVFFNSRRPLPGEEAPSPQHNVWFVERTAAGWGEPQFVGPPLNDYRPVYFSIANDGTLYFTRSRPREICFAEPENGQYGEINSLPDEINGLRDVAHPAIAPDESYLIVDSCYREGNVITGSLYISFRESDGSWTKAVSMRAALGASPSDVYASPRITPDGKYLLFENYDQETDRADICWVSTRVIEGLRSQVLQAEEVAESTPTLVPSGKPEPTTTPLPTNTPEPDPTPDGRGGGVIAYCYQPITGANTKKEIHALNADGSGDVKMIDTEISLNHHDWSPDAQKLAAVGYAGDGTWSIYVFDADGSNLTRLTFASDVWVVDPTWSPDGAQIAFTKIYPNQDNREEIWLMNSDGSDQHWIGVEGGSAKWSPDGTRFIYHSLKDENYDIFTCNTDGTDEQQLTFAPSGEIVPVYSPDGTQIAFSRVGDDMSHEICIMDSDGTNIRRLTDGGAPKWSPDGSLIAFHAGPFEEWEVYIINSDGTGLRQLTNSPPGITAINPVWRPE